MSVNATEAPAALLLRQAADRLDKAAQAATKGVCPNWIYSAVRHIARNCNVDCGHDEHDEFDAPTWDRYEDAPWLQLARPELGPPLASWLRSTAATVDAVTKKHQDAATADAHWLAPAIAFAEQIMKVTG